MEIDLLSLGLGIVLGVAAAYVWYRGYVPARALTHLRDEIAAATAKREEFRKQGERMAGDLDDARFSLAEAREAHSALQERHATLREQHSALRAEAEGSAASLRATIDETSAALRAERIRTDDLRRRLDASLAETTDRQARLVALQEQLDGQGAEFAKLREHAREEFTNLSQRLLTSSSAQLREAHESSLRQLLDPVRTKLQEFEQTVAQKFVEEGKDKTMLRAQIEQLTALNQDLSHEARQLTRALKGDGKTQGDWGEHRLERLLEAAGLQAGTHFDTQASFGIGEHARQQQRPDCIVRLPQGRCIIIDAKVSLTAYEQFCGSEHEDDARRHLQAHVHSVRTHIKGLSAKRYQDIHQVKCPDYVLLFVPLEPAFIAAVRERSTLFTEALDAQVVLVCPSTLLATMRTVSHIWQQEDQRENAQHIAEVGKKLYNKFVGFVEDMNAVGKQLDGATGAYNAAMNKLSRSPKQGTTLVAQANKLRALGVDGKTLLSEETHAG